MTPDTDEAIVRQVQSGNTELFGLLLERYEGKMMRYARRFLFGYHDAEDAVQEIFIKAFTNIQSFDASRRFSPWLYRLAHNELVNVIKKKGRSRCLFLIRILCGLRLCPKICRTGIGTAKKPKPCWIGVWRIWIPSTANP